MAVTNQVLTLAHITKRSLMVLRNQLVFANLVNREYSDEFKGDGAKVGDTISIRKPARFTVREGRVANPQAFVETKIPLKLDQQTGIDVEFTSKEMTLDVEEFDSRILTPQIAQVANTIDRKLLYMAYTSTANTVTGAADQLRTYLKAGAVLDSAAAPRDGNRSIVTDPIQTAVIVDSLKGIFNDQSEVGKQYKDGVMRRAAGFNWGMDQNVWTHTTGSLAGGGSATVDGAGQIGATLNTKGWTASTLVLKKGDVFSVGLNSINPASRADTGQVRWFVATADVTTDGTGKAVIPIFPSIVPADNSANTDPTTTTSPANNAPLTFAGTAGQILTQGLAFHRDAFTLASADLILPKGTHAAERASSKAAGLSVRMIQDYDSIQDVFLTRLDVLYGMAAIYPEWAVRLQSPQIQL